MSKRLTSSSPSILTRHSLPVYQAPRLLAEWGEDRARYASAASVQAVAGTVAGMVAGTASVL